MLQRVAVAIRQQIMAPTKSPRELLTVTQPAEFLGRGGESTMTEQVQSKKNQRLGKGL